MLRIKLGDLQRGIGQIHEMTLVPPLTITNNGRDWLVILSIDEYRRLKQRDREVLGVEDFTEADLEAIRKAETPSGAATFDHEMND